MAGLGREAIRAVSKGGGGRHVSTGEKIRATHDSMRRGREAERHVEGVIRIGKGRK